MLKSYFRFGWRNLVKSKAYSLINVSGLAIGLACCLGIALFIHDEFSYDTFHKDLPNLYRVVEKQKQAGTMYNVAATPGPLGPAMKKDLPEVQEVCRLGRTVGIFEVGEKSIEPSDIRLSDNSFFTLFNFNVIKGNPGQMLQKADEIVLTSSTAAQLFGTDWRNKPNVIGTTINAILWGEQLSFTLTGIVDNPPANSHIRFDVLLSISLIEKKEYFIWDNNSYYTYFKLDPSADPAAFDQKLRTYIDRYSENNSKDDARTLWVQPMKDIYLHSKFDFGTEDAKISDIVYTRIFFAVGVMVLLIAIFNFVNLSTARATHRAREVGVRKVIGALYKQLVTQFLIESFILTALAVTLALGLLQVCMPLLNDLSGKTLYVPFEQPVFIFTVVVSTIVISVLAGMYPAFYLSNFAPAKVLKGFLRIRSGISFRRVLVIGQFTFSVILVIGSIVIYRQLHFIQDKELGFDRSQVISVRLKNNLRGAGMMFKEELKNESSIASAAPTSNSMIDVTNSTWGIQWEGQLPDDRFLVTLMNTDNDLLTTLGMTLIAGRNFIPGGVDTASYLINETAAKRMGWSNDQALGKSVTLWNTPGTIIGVVKDFHFRPMTQVIEPFLFRSWPKSGVSGVFVKTQPGRTRDAISAIERIYKKHETKTALNYQFLDDALNEQYRMQQNTGSIVLFFSILAVLVSCLGLFGLATYAAEQRTKEIGIRKVLGASITSIVRLLSSDFLKLVTISIIIAAPIAWWTLSRWLHDFAYKINIEWWMFAAASVIALLIALLTVSYHSIKTAVMNPVKSLRAE